MLWATNQQVTHLFHPTELGLELRKPKKQHNAEFLGVELPSRPSASRTQRTSHTPRISDYGAETRKHVWGSELGPYTYWTLSSRRTGLYVHPLRVWRTSFVGKNVDCRGFKGTRVETF